MAFINGESENSENSVNYYYDTVIPSEQSPKSHSLLQILNENED